MGSNYVFFFLGGGLVLGALYARRTLFDWRRNRNVPSPIEAVIRRARLNPTQAAALGALAACGSAQDPPPFSSPEAFDRKAVLRLREVLRRGEDVRGEAERLRLLRRSIGFAEPSTPGPKLLSPVFLVSPTGERCDGIVLGIEGDYLVVAARGSVSSLRTGGRLAVTIGAEERVEDAGGTVVATDDLGDCRIVRIGFTKDDGQSRRRHFRLVARLQAAARIGEESLFESATVTDISRTGVRLQLRTARTPRKGEPVSVQIRVGEELFEPKGMVAWALPALYGGGGEQPWLVGADFPEFSIEDWTRIVEKVLSAAGGGPAKAGARTIAPEAIL